MVVGVVDAALDVIVAVVAVVVAVGRSWREKRWTRK